MHTTRRDFLSMTAALGALPIVSVPALPDQASLYDAELLSIYTAFRRVVDEEWPDFEMAAISLGVSISDAENEYSKAWCATADELAKAALKITAHSPAGLAVKISVLGWYSGLLFSQEDDMEGRAWLELVADVERVTGVRV